MLWPMGKWPIIRGCRVVPTNFRRRLRRPVIDDREQVVHVDLAVAANGHEVAGTGLGWWWRCARAPVIDHQEQVIDVYEAVAVGIAERRRAIALAGIGQTIT